MGRTKAIIEQTLGYVEENINRKITLDDIAEDCNISKYYLHRLFKALTGERLMDYVLYRKLSSSIDYLMNADLRVIDIAHEYGFDYEQNYIRAFKKFFGLTPLKARSTLIGLKVREKISIDEIMTDGDALTYKPQFIVKPAFHITGIRHKIWGYDDFCKANRCGRKFFYDEREAIANIQNRDVYLGYVDWSFEHLGYDFYIPAALTTKNENPPEGMINILIPSHKYVVFKFTGFFSPNDITEMHILPLIHYMYGKWIYNAGYEIAAQFRFEYIDMGISKDNYCELDIYQPIRRRNE